MGVTKRVRNNLVTKQPPQQSLCTAFALFVKESTWKWKALSHGRLCDPMDYTAHGILQARILEWVAFPFSGDLPSPLQVDTSPAEPQGKPKNTGVGSISLLQGIFPTQESNWSLLHCRQILYQLSCQESPKIKHLDNILYLSLMKSPRNNDCMTNLKLPSTS